MIVSSFLWTQYRSVTERQTGGQTDGIPLATTAVCIASNADALEKCEHTVYKELNKPVRLLSPDIYARSQRGTLIQRNTGR